MGEKRIIVALAGNPNSGKTTLFNSLTGSTAHVGNWPGVTVDKREGTYKKLEKPIDIIDLPGIYSLSPYTPEEVISRNYILDEKPDCVINVVDATNLERNLYLTTQLLEIDVPLVVALNMSDVVRKNGDLINVEELSKKLGVPVVEISALKEENLDSLMAEAYKAAAKGRVGKTVLESKELLHLIDDIKIAFKGKGVENPLFHAIKLVEMDELETKSHPDLIPMVEEFKASHADEVFGDDYEALIADARYKYISSHYAITLSKKDGNASKDKLSRSDKIDKVLTHRIWALPIFVLIMFIIFHVTFSEDLLFIGRITALAQGVAFDDLELITDPFWIRFLSADYLTPLEELAPLNGVPSIGVWLQSQFGFCTGSLIEAIRGSFGGGFIGIGMEEHWFTSLICDGLFTGLDAVLSFIPQIMILFLFIAILEDSGYMARIAFILDRAFRKFGLSGKAFIPMLTGFGCSVPGIMATRTLEDEKEKNRTIRLMTCFSCGAKAPIWALLAAVGVYAGFDGGIFVFSIYLLGIAAAVIFALFMKLFSKDQYVSPFIMELPAYHLPQFRNVMAHLWEKLKHYVIKAGTIIAASTIVIWFLSNFNWNLSLGMVAIEESMLADLGRTFNYLFFPIAPLEGGWTNISGWNVGDGWKYSVSTITGLIAKEDVVATMAELGLEEGTIFLQVEGVYSFALFNLFTLPCFAAMGAAYGEQNKKEFGITILWWLGISYGASLICYWVMHFCRTLPGLGYPLLVVLIGAVIAAGIIVSNRHKNAQRANA
ncbi:MAG: ferrous iron transporter B [Bacilli bacterium]|nr:ferrous iron transporter B [Bacilli bacterium]